MKRPAQHHFRVSLTSSVRARLTLWYLAMVAFITILFGGGLYVTQTFLSADAAESRLETQLYQDSQRFADIYRQALLERQAPTALRLNSSSQEMVLLLRTDGSVLDARGPLTGSLTQQLQARAGQNAGMSDLTISQNHSHSWWAGDTTYRVLMMPVLNQNARVATHSLTGDLAFSRHTGPASRSDRGLLAGGQSAPPGQEDYTNGTRN